MSDSGALSREELEARLALAESTLRAIQRGEVDAILMSVDGQTQVYSLEGADAFYRVLVEEMPGGAATVDADGRVLYANSAMAALLGIDLESFMGTRLSGFVGALQRADVLAVLAADAPPREPMDVVLVRTDGTEVHVAFSVSRVDGQAPGVRCVVAVDLTARHRSEAATREADARFRTAFDHAPIGMAVLDLDGTVLQANKALEDIVGRPAPTLIGEPLPWLPEDGTGSILQGVIDGTDDHFAREHRHLVDGTVKWVDTTATVVSDDTGAPRNLIVQVQDVSARRLHQDQLVELAHRDGLTGLLNRRGFDRELERHLADRRRGTDASRGALLLFDVDHFKYVNDSRGHHFGDEVLVAIAVEVARRLRATDVMARLGGDEFAILLPDVHQDLVGEVAQSILDAVRSMEITRLGGNRPLTISAGIVPTGTLDTTPGDLLALADLAMYDAKEAGRDQAVVRPLVDGATSVTTARLSRLSTIERSMNARLLGLDEQPIVDVHSGQVCAHELLVRLPVGDVRLAAAEWFGDAERYGLAPAIDVWVLEQAVALLDADATRRLSVNVSAKTLVQPAWLDHLRASLERTSVDASRLTCEITETATFTDLGAAVRFSEEVRALGCRLALDDFGAGFGSFTYLKHLPFDDIKIDGEFVRECVHNRHDLAIIRSMVNVARSMDKRTVAEYVESGPILELLRDEGVDFAQGTHLGAPTPVTLVGSAAIWNVEAAPEADAARE